MGDKAFAALICAAKKLAEGGSQEIRDAAAAFLKRLFEEYGHGPCDEPEDDASTNP